MAENVLEVKFSLSNIKEKKGRESVLKEIKKNVCALLNTNGGKLVLTASDVTADNKIDADVIVRPVEQYFEDIIGIYEVHIGFQVLGKKDNTITLGIQALPILCTFYTHMYLPTITQIRLISCMDKDALQHIFERRIFENSEQEVPEEFFSGCECGLYESKTVQFKQLKTERKKTNFADRVINNKFTSIISGFANATGGNIFYGVNDDGIVEGELLSDAKELDKTTEKLEKAVGKMIWRDKSRKVERGKEWDIKFVSVKDCNHEAIPSTFVMVVTVHPYFGGVFAEEPESYYVEDGNVKRMPFDIWRQNTCYKVAQPVQELGRSSWSSENNKTRYMKITQTFENIRQLGNWTRIKSIADEVKRRNDLPVSTKLTCLFQIVALYYRQGDFEEAENLLKEFRKDMGSAEDKSVFAVKERYSASAIERSRGNYQEAWKIIEECLKLAQNVPAGYIPASVYVNAATILSSLVDEEASIDGSKKDEDPKSKVHELVQTAKSFCGYALQHLLYVEDDFEIAREDLRQRIIIALASLCVKSAEKDHSPNSNPDKELDEAMKLITKSEESLIKLKRTKRLTYNSCRQLLVKSDVYFQKYQLEKADIRTEHLNDASKYVREARELAVENHFEEIKRLCEERSQKIQDELKRVKDKATQQREIDEKIQTKKIVDDFLKTSKIDSQRKLKPNKRESEEKEQAKKTVDKFG